MPSQQLLDDIIHGPIITSSSVTEFAHQCQAAVLLRRSHPGSLTSLDELTTQKNLFNRLNDDLHLKWYEYKCTHLQKTPTFEEFSRWIDAQSEIHLERQDHLSKHQTSTWQTTPSSGYKVQASPNQSRRANKPSVTRTQRCKTASGCARLFCTPMQRATVFLISKRQRAFVTISLLQNIDLYNSA